MLDARAGAVSDVPPRSRFRSMTVPFVAAVPSPTAAAAMIPTWSHDGQRPHVEHDRAAFAPAGTRRWHHAKAGLQKVAHCGRRGCGERCHEL